MLAQNSSRIWNLRSMSPFRPQPSSQPGYRLYPSWRWPSVLVGRLNQRLQVLTQQRPQVREAFDQTRNIAQVFELLALPAFRSDGLGEGLKVMTVERGR